MELLAFVFFGATCLASLFIELRLHSLIEHDEDEYRLAGKPSAVGLWFNPLAQIQMSFYILGRRLGEVDRVELRNMLRVGKIVFVTWYTALMFLAVSWGNA